MDPPLIILLNPPYPPCHKKIIVSTPCHKNHFLAYPRAGRQCRGSHPKISEHGLINIFNLRTEQPSVHATNPQDARQNRFLPLAELSLGYTIWKDPNFGIMHGNNIILILFFHACSTPRLRPCSHSWN